MCLNLHCVLPWLSLFKRLSRSALPGICGRVVLCKNHIILKRVVAKERVPSAHLMGRKSKKDRNAGVEEGGRGMTESPPGHTLQGSGSCSMVAWGDQGTLSWAKSPESRPKLGTEAPKQRSSCGLGQYAGQHTPGAVSIQSLNMLVRPPNLLKLLHQQEGGPKKGWAFTSSSPQWKKDLHTIVDLWKIKHVSL